MICQSQKSDTYNFFTIFMPFSSTILDKFDLQKTCDTESGIPGSWGVLSERLTHGACVRARISACRALISASISCVLTMYTLALATMSTACNMATASQQHKFGVVLTMTNKSSFSGEYLRIFYFDSSKRCAVVWLTIFQDYDLPGFFKWGIKLPGIASIVLFFKQRWFSPFRIFQAKLYFRDGLTTIIGIEKVSFDVYLVAKRVAYVASILILLFMNF